ncbi:alpha/beta hydrolase [Sphingomonas colocasiae]|uniref:Alpha/beta hydrolase n=1 Tax=Sphingomonas colocasiae TaxID=1848973 RepID=A0ABS7PRH8_9SPHN|nr:alpha/beta hydrolase [Sphingomonas colocasiae]MBY8822614.1 alpha/beta hydrolase [Sphingomonas colocasiae]
MRRVRRRPIDYLLTVMSRDWAALALALILTLTGLLLIAFGASIAGSLLILIALLAATGGIVHLAQVRRAMAAHPAPGRLIDVGGHRIHLLAEGDANGAPAIVWLPGAHGAGIALDHLHRMLRGDGRSILIDRPGSGWSDPGPFPRTTMREVEEIIAALDKAGEQGPFVFAGHSFGGFLAAAIARHRPASVAGLVLLDATPPETIVFGPPNPFLSQMRRGALWSATIRLFGFRRSAAERRQRDDPTFASVIAAVRDAQGPKVDAAIEALGLRTRETCAAASIFEELSPEGMARIAWDAIAYDRDLGDLPVFLVAPGDTDAERDVMKAIVTDGAGDPNRAPRFYAASRERYLAISTRAERIRAPAGTGHNFVYEAPEFTAAAVRRMRDTVSTGARA